LGVCARRLCDELAQRLEDRIELVVAPESCLSLALEIIETALDHGVGPLARPSSTNARILAMFTATGHFSLASQMLDSIATPCSVNRYGARDGARRAPGVDLAVDLADCDLNRRRRQDSFAWDSAATGLAVRH
jgi:hypothetical protein